MMRTSTKQNTTKKIWNGKSHKKSKIAQFDDSSDGQITHFDIVATKSNRHDYGWSHGCLIKLKQAKEIFEKQKLAVNLNDACLHAQEYIDKNSGKFNTKAKTWRKILLPYQYLLLTAYIKIFADANRSFDIEQTSINLKRLYLAFERLKSYFENIKRNLLGIDNPESIKGFNGEEIGASLATFDTCIDESQKDIIKATYLLADLKAKETLDLKSPVDSKQDEVSKLKSSLDSKQFEASKLKSSAYFKQAEDSELKSSHIFKQEEPSKLQSSPVSKQTEVSASKSPANSKQAEVLELKSSADSKQREDSESKLSLYPSHAEASKFNSSAISKSTEELDSKSSTELQQRAILVKDLLISSELKQNETALLAKTGSDIIDSKICEILKNFESPKDQVENKTFEELHESVEIFANENSPISQSSSVKSEKSQDLKLQTKLTIDIPDEDFVEIDYGKMKYQEIPSPINSSILKEPGCCDRWCCRFWSKKPGGESLTKEVQKPSSPKIQTMY